MGIVGKKTLDIFVSPAHVNNSVLNLSSSYIIEQY